MVSSINFALKNEEERRAIIKSFQNFLNSLDFSCQILVQSRKINITGYLDELKKRAQKEKNRLLQEQITSYTRFIEQLVEEGNIMTKRFFVVVPFDVITPEAVTEVSFRAILKTLFPQKNVKKIEFEQAKEQLWQRMEFVALGLQRIGLRVVPLTSQEIAELLWELYHPQEAERGYYPTIPPEVWQS